LAEKDGQLEELRTTFHEQASRNKLRSYLLAAAVVVVISVLVFVIWQVLDPFAGVGVLFYAGIISIIYGLTTYYAGDKIVLATTHARPLQPDKSTKELMVKNLVESLAISAHMPVPKLYVVESREMNAFATGRDPEHASLAVTTGLLERLNRDELEGVLGHEMSHIANYDVRFNTVVAVMVGIAAILSDFFLRSMMWGGGRNRDDRGGNFGLLVIVGLILAIVAPIVTRVAQAAVSRKREGLADAYGAKLCGNPDALADALEKISRTNKGDMPVDEAVSHLFFVDPLVSSLDKLFATHPPVKERIAVLRAMS
jgi:heat shock protein HtpX